ncbi:cytochrome c [Flavobacterium sp. DGU11]|uniref:Cytochrome c n=1 Tax=Flavobacterium arundinis TaxID=3139143 RepID=A0ABU9HUP2_9FLAO
MLEGNKRIYMFCVAVLFSIFGFYNYTIYSGSTTASGPPFSDKALSGQELWQSNNCFSCHQLYGLGGYMGPDLTNICSEKGKDEKYIKLMLNSGIKTMPLFNFTEDEKDAIVCFLKEVDATGYYPNYKAVIHTNGWVEIDIKDEK